MTAQPSPLRGRGSGVLLHPTSLPGPYGIGDLGPAAYRWVDALATAGQQWWQLLPLAPTGYADSPYQCLSTFAGNFYLISPDELIREGLLRRDDVASSAFADGYADYDRVIPFKVKLLTCAWENFRRGLAPALRPDFEQFCQAEAGWLDDFALFMALKDAHGGASWLAWETELKARQPAALVQARATLADAIEQHRFRQFLFFRQWRAVKAYAHTHGVKVIGDVPIFVAADSADVWSNPESFHLDEQRRPKVVAGVPPDYFSATGQLWGNPLYNWETLKQTGYAWWVNRVRAAFNQVDLVRIDHFRGFEAYWEVPGADQTAEHGQWVKGPGADLFDTLAERLGTLAIIAEDLGTITPEVDALRTRYNFPGMRILQFAFAGAVEERFLPHNYERNTVVYTGTHDNDTTRGWSATATEAECAFMERYSGQVCTEETIAWVLIRLAWASVADLAVAPLQDVLNLGSEARMNLPGRPAGWWRWRVTESQLTGPGLDRLGELTEAYQRAAPKK
jgi:4-alpha-glucanotransferase